MSYLSENITFYSAMFMWGFVICFRIFTCSKNELPQEEAGDSGTSPMLTNLTVSEHQHKSVVAYPCQTARVV